MMTNAIIDFISRDCRSTIHQNCCGIWRGLGFEVLCDCKCHKRKEQQALAEVGGPASNATLSLTQEPTQDDD
jgi:hypothetical protein